jgi:hypothetical protein
MRTVAQIDPVQDSRWSRLVAVHPSASIFHTAGWLRALDRTYGFQPVVYTNAEDGAELTNGLVFCQVDSWLTGRRLVSLPFSDHCDPLMRSESELGALLERVRECLPRDGKYIEIRQRQMALSIQQHGFRASQSFCLHTLDLAPGTECLLRRMHKDCIQRKIARAEREHVSYESGRDEALLRKFYTLLLITRSRQHLPPQPYRWFKALADFLGDKLTLRVASKDGVPIASVLTLRHRSTTTYKYGCSDAKFHHLGGMPYLFWRTIVEEKESGAEILDLGRSDWDTHGLIAFKDRLGATRSTLNYCRAESSTGSLQTSLQVAASRLSVRLPRPLLATAGRLLYKHFG